ncbi:endolytic transglycosylase MltG [Microbacterium sp. CFBP9034]|uniref:endolytic transglycosylase MltG n=1 Tax=Microbacterium sp. CFBP9034 TaxID=3096540 RepID=UPI002A69BFAC|nr:endolytic transglycosylase MltG [Microbacterium sp. CFBP9034]MDY0909767.1 endolytic transglycosylase MltG [Microbacterium sp. CFBP9034]
MPHSTPDDPFADLFGNLPDPRGHDLRSNREDSGYGAAPAPGGAGASQNADGAPLSRREAREAAARQSTGGVAVGSLPSPAAPVDPSPAVPESGPPLDESGMLAQPRAYAGAPTPTDADADEDDSWPIADGSAPALPYSRTGSTPQVAAAVAVTPSEAVAGRSERRAAAPSSSAPAEPERVAPDRVAPTATLEDLFTGSRSTDDLGSTPPPKNKRRRRIGGWIALGVILAILGGIAGGAWYVWTTYEEQIREVMGWEEPQDYEEGMANGEAYVTVASGDTGSPISQSLYDAGVTKTPDAFYDYLIESGQNPPFVPGVFKLQKQMTSEAALAALLEPANKMENTAQLREGLTVEQSLPLLAEGTGIPLEEFEAAVADPSAYDVSADSLEGWLFPATYTFDPDVTAEGIIQTLVDRTVKSLDTAGVPVDQRQEILTIASIIQREARYEADMQKVSRVIQNRLDPSNQETFGKLQMDSTAQFGFGELHDGSASSSEEALKDPNPWNTYVHPGLPVGPIANPGDVAIDAAMHPADGSYLYFVTVNMDTGETVFTDTYSEHLRYVDQMLAWCSEHPDSGC